MSASKQPAKKRGRPSEVGRGGKKPTSYAGQLGQRIHQARTKAGLTLAQVAEEIGVSPASISSWEHGEYEPPAGDLVALAAALECSAAGLLTGRPEA